MKQASIVKFDPKKDKSRTDRDRVRRLSDREISRAVAADPDAATILTKEWFKHAQALPPLTKKGVFLRLDPDILEWFRRQGPGYQTRMNGALRAYMEAHGPQGKRRVVRRKAKARAER